MNISQLRDVDKVRIFTTIFAGRTDVYGTYNPEEGKSWQVKEKVDERVIHAHLCGHKSFGLYPLKGKYTKLLAIDFDHEPLEVAVDCVSMFLEIGLQSYIEISKSKGYHVWLFFNEFVVAANARLIAKKVLEDIGKSDAEIFPKQDQLEGDTYYGNFINAPLFGKIAIQGKTVFLDFDNMPNPCENQWQLLSQVKTYNNKFLEAVIQKHNISPTSENMSAQNNTGNNFGLVPCMKTILKNGVNSNQRVACYRLAIRLKQLGIPFDIAVVALYAWANKNTPIEGKRIITPEEINSQASFAYQNNNTSFGCSDSAISAYCDQKCPVYKFKRGNNEK